ncbi:MAG: SRPBCC family protein [Ktedonobacterales bacterium]
MGSGYRVELESSAPPSRIYDLLADAAAWEKWAPLVGHSELIRRGSPDPLGAGAIRRVSGLKVLRAEEEIVEAGVAAGSMRSDVAAEKLAELVMRLMVSVGQSRALDGHTRASLDADDAWRFCLGGLCHPKA